MNIIEISISKLFGIFDHKISLNQDSNVTIVIGENGIGKTKVLEAVSAIFNNNYEFLIELDFAELTISFDNKESWVFYKSKEGKTPSINIKKEFENSIVKNDKLFVLNKSDHLKSTAMELYDIEMKMELNSIRNRFLHDHIINKSELSNSNLEREFYMRSLRQKNEKIKPPKWLIEDSEKITVRLIETQRIMTRNETRDNAYTSMVMQCSNELKHLISNAIKTSADITSALDSTYPNRLVKNLRKENDYTYSQLNEDLADLNEKRKFLSATGLVVDAQDSELAVIEDEHNDLIVISMRQYVEDSKEKLEPYESLAKKISLFMSIVSSRFKHKRLKVSKEDGLKFTSIISNANKKPLEIELTKLSSGEQHELVLFYKLIFNSEPGDLILIDEPELSLHISWQNQFINDLKKVAKINEFSALIATHSPDIISSNWDLRVELEGIE